MLTHVLRGYVVAPVLAVMENYVVRKVNPNRVILDLALNYT